MLYTYLKGGLRIMDNNQFNQFNQANPQTPNMSTKKIFEFVGFGCACLGFVLSVIFTIVTCARGPKASGIHMKMSLWIIGVIIAGCIAVAGLVFSILSKEKGQKLGKIPSIAVIVATAALLFAIIPNVTICSYNCSWNKYMDDQGSKADIDLDDYSSLF